MNQPKDPSPSVEQKLEQVLAQYLHALDSQRPIPQQALIARHPELADELRSFFQNRDALQRAAAPLYAETLALAGTEYGDDESPQRIRYLGDYELLSEIARGGMGVVYRARQASLNRIVAVKMILGGMLASADDVRRFQQEAEAAANLDHPQIVPIYEIGVHQGQHYFSMKLIEGRSLAVELREHADSISLRRAAELTASVARAVHHAHQRGVLHRDLKPGNILLDTEGTPHVTDFGLAKRVEGAGELTQSGAVVGTPAYMAPEQASAQRPLSTAADVYSLGAILYELLTGRPPFVSSSPVETLLQVISSEPVRPGSIRVTLDRDLETICLKCLEKEPARRYDSASALADDLHRWLGGEPILARPVGTGGQLVRWTRRSPLVAGLVAATILAAMGALFSVSIAGWRANVARRDALRSAVAERSARTAQAAMLYANQIGRAHIEWQTGNARRAFGILQQCDEHRRGWEWHYVRRQCAPQLQQYELRSGRATLVHCSPQGRFIAAAGEYQDVHLWDLTSEEYRFTRRWHTLPIRALAFSADETRLASLDDQTLFVWDPMTARQTLRIDLGPRAHYHSIAWSAAGDRLIVVGDAQRAEFDATSGMPLGIPASASTQSADPEKAVSLGPTPWGRRVDTLALSPTGNHAAAAYSSSATSSALHLMHEKPSLTLWDLEQERVLATLYSQQRGALAAPTFSHDGQALLWAGATAVQSWPFSSGFGLNVVGDHADTVRQIAWGPDAAAIVTLSAADGLRIWDRPYGAQRSLVPQDSSQRWLTDAGRYSFALSPDGSRVVVMTEFERKLFDLTSGAEPQELEAPGLSNYMLRPLFSSDGKIIVGVDASSLFVWDAHSGKLLRRHAQIARGAQAIALSSDARRLIIAGGHERRPAEEAAAQQEIDVFRAMIVPLESIPEHPATSPADHSDRLPVGAVLLTQGHRGLVSSAAFSPDGRWIATGTGNRNAQEKPFAGLQTPVYGEVFLWDATGHQLMHTLRGHTGDVTALSFTADGTRLFSASIDGLVKLWDTASGQELLTLRDHSGPVHDVALSSDGNWLATAGAGPQGSGDVILYDGSPWSAEAAQPEIFMETADAARL